MGTKSGMLYKRRESRFWWIKYYRNGRPVRESTGTEKETEARRILRERLGDLAAGRPVVPRADRVRFEDLAENFLNDYRVNGKRSLDRAEDSVEHLKGYFAAWKAINITTPAVRTYIAKRQEAEAGNGTINRELAALKRMFSLALQAEKLLRQPYIPHLHEDNVRTGFYGEVEFLALYEALPAYLKPVALFAYTFGWRIKSELLGLTWERVDLAAGTVRLDPGTTKNREGRVVVLTPDLKRVLVGQWQAARAIVLKRNPEATGRDIAKAVPWVFHRNGERIKSFRQAWLTACKKAGLIGRIPHDFRRTAVRNMVRAGIPERVAMMISGHKTRSVFERYNIVSEADLRAAAERLSTLALPAGTVAGTEKESAALVAAQVLEKMVGRGRIELPTPGFSVLCSTN
jgi:integrase